MAYISPIIKMECQTRGPNLTQHFESVADHAEENKTASGQSPHRGYLQHTNFWSPKYGIIPLLPLLLELAGLKGS